MTKSHRQEREQGDGRSTGPRDAAADSAWDERLAPPEPAGGTNRMILLVTAGGIVVAAALFGLAGYATMVPRTPASDARPPTAPADPAQAESAAAPAVAAPRTGESEPDAAAPASQDAPDGVTVLARSGEEPEGAAAPAAAGPQPGLGWSIDLGGAMSFSELSRRFAELAELNQEIPFDRLEPRAIIADSASGLEARLLVGPFAGEDDARAACESLALPGGVECRAHPFEGELIARE